MTEKPSFTQLLREEGFINSSGNDSVDNEAENIVKEAENIIEEAEKTDENVKVEREFKEEKTVSNSLKTTDNTSTSSIPLPLILIILVILIIILIMLGMH